MIAKSVVLCIWYHGFVTSASLRPSQTKPGVFIICICGEVRPFRRGFRRYSSFCQYFAERVRENLDRFFPHLPNHLTPPPRLHATH